MTEERRDRAYLTEDELDKLDLLIPPLMYLARVNHERQAVGGEKSGVG